ncbi:MAG: TlpA family protein disulfide reductase [Planctomycetes bacterium]|nr:TlpA family protein disulfide reductase [Planctomycetota bacterium]
MKNLKGRPFVLLGVHVGGTSVQKLKEIVTKEGLTWRSFSDNGTAGAGRIARAWNHSMTPTFFLIDREGIIRNKWAGPPGAEIVDAAVTKLVAAAEAASRPAK